MMISITGKKQDQGKLVFHGICRTNCSRVGPTAQELMRLMQTNLGNRLSAEVDEVVKSFASLLNRGSCQE
jgi:hypothetical protein